MKIFLYLGSLYANFLKKLNLCSLVGYLAGGMSGGMLTLYGVFQGGVSVNQNEVLSLTILLALFAFFFIFIILWGFVKMKIGSFFVGSLINCCLTAGLTLLAINGTVLYPIAWLVGMIIGVLVGLVLCWLNSAFQKFIIQS